MNIYASLFKSFILIGLGAYGGGLVTIPLIQHEIVKVRAWITFNDMASLLAIAQMTPGPIAINAATFTGFKTAGFYGSGAATAGVVFPALSLLFFLAPFFEKALDNDHLKRLWKGFDTGVLSLIIFAAFGACRPGILFFMILLLVKLLARLDAVVTRVASEALHSTLSTSHWPLATGYWPLSTEHFTIYAYLCYSVLWRIL